VVIASHRQTRTHLPPTDQCPLCPSGPGRLTEIPADDYDVVVFANRFPSLSYGAQAGVVDLGGDGVFPRRAGIGRCEVVCFTANHDTSFAQLPPERVATVLEAWIDRTREPSRLDGVEHVFVFENRGREIGVTLSHPHGQIYAGLRHRLPDRRRHRHPRLHSRRRPRPGRTCSPWTRPSRVGTSFTTPATGGAIRCARWSRPPTG
jgi:UDPglucose--hexose-1-phosphate uridylyltransferase